MLKAGAGFAFVLAVAGCVAAPDVQEGPMIDPLATENACGAEDLQGLVGQKASVLETMRFSQVVRVIKPGMAVTMDFSATRLNIEVDEEGLISRVSCG